MAPQSFTHLDPGRFGALLALSDAELRVALALVAASDEGLYVKRPDERVLARAAGLTVTDYRAAIASLAKRPGPSGAPWITVPARTDGPIDLAGFDGLLVRHVATKTEKVAKAPEEQVRPRAIGQLVDSARERVVALAGEEGATKTDAWLSVLAAGAGGEQIPARVALLQYDMVARIAAEWGAAVALETLEAGLANPPAGSKRPDAYLRGIAQRRAGDRDGKPVDAKVRPTTVGRAKVAAPRGKAAEPAPYRDEDLF